MFTSKRVYAALASSLLVLVIASDVGAPGRGRKESLPLHERPWPYSTRLGSSPSLSKLYLKGDLAKHRQLQEELNGQQFVPGGVFSGACTSDADCMPGEVCRAATHAGTASHHATTRCVRVDPVMRMNAEQLRGTENFFNGISGTFFPGSPTIECKNPTFSAALGDAIEVSVAGLDNDLFLATVPTNDSVFIQTKELFTKENIALQFNFNCDLAGQFKVKFVIELNDGFQSFQKALNICGALFNCVEGTVEETPETGDGGEDQIETMMALFKMQQLQLQQLHHMQQQKQQQVPIEGGQQETAVLLQTPPTVQKTQPRDPNGEGTTAGIDVNSAKEPRMAGLLKCVPHEARAKIGTSVKVPVSPGVVSLVDAYASKKPHLAISVTGVTSTGRRISSDSTAVAKEYRYDCDEAEVAHLNFAVMAIDLGGAAKEPRYDLKTCSVDIHCVGNTPPVITCRGKDGGPLMRFGGKPGAALSVDVLSNANDLFTATDADATDDLHVGVVDSDSGEMLWSLSHECAASFEAAVALGAKRVTARTDGYSLQRDVTVTAFDGEAKTKATCSVVFACAV
eukprot:GHVU01053917.1.p1 GENE.GHVU01053917.1~~GHVU01053917.1.p1  ORF type:complete len:568 (-),score=98.15 GHVU01053917.1:1407-3110(-)